MSIRNVWPVAAVLACASMSASAVTYTIGTLPLAPAVYTNTGTVPAGSFTDTYNFTFPLTGSTASESAVSVNVGTILGINNIAVSLYTAGNVLVATGITAGSSASLFNVPLAAGAPYYYRVTGTGTGSSGGVYSFLASATAVPEPGTYAMMLAGLGIVCLMGLRHRAN